MMNPIEAIKSVNTAGTVQPVSIPQSRAQTKVNSGPDDLTFSKHLSERMNLRKLDLSGDKLSRLNQAVKKVADKGARDSVVLLDNLAVLVNVSKRTVLTAIETQKMKDGVFTNIDSVVVG